MAASKPAPSAATQKLIDEAVQTAVAQAGKGLVVAASKPQMVNDLRKTWRKSAEHKAAQAKRFVSILIGVFVLQVGGDIGAHKNPFAALHNGRDLLYYLAPFAFVAWRQYHPALTASQVDSAPGVTIVPEQVGTPTPVAITPDPTPDPTTDTVLPLVPDPVVPEGDAAP